MAILEGNIKLLSTQVMDDVEEGGGQPTGTAIQDGASNAIFPDISELDRTIGRVNLRKVFVNVETTTVEGYFGSNVIVADPPNDERVSCTLFTTKDGFDRRSSAKSRLEAYVIRGPLARMRLYGTQVIGQRAVLAYQRVEEPLPEVGQVYVLSTENSQGVSTLEEFFRVTEVAHEVRTFTDTSGDFQRRVLTLKIGAALRSTFVGLEPVRVSSDGSPTKIRDTQVADTTSYYGTSPLRSAVAIGDLTVRATGVFSQLVPASTAESPISLARISGIVGLVAANTATRVETPFTSPSATIVRGFLNMPVLPGALSLTCSGFTATDDGNGKLTGTLIDTAFAATVDYSSGLLAFTRVSSAVNAVLATYTPAGEVLQAAHTHQVPVTLANRGSVYSLTLRPFPAPRTLIVDYLAQGKWYRMQDTGNGVLAGTDPSVGAGAINYTSGAVVITLGALPDADSAILLWWGSKAHFLQKAGPAATAANTVTVRRTLANRPIVPETLVVSWTVNGVVRTATTTSLGVISGTGATGTVNKTTGEVVLDFTLFPDKGTQIGYAYDYLTPNTPGALVFKETITTTNGTTIDAGAALTAGTVTLSFDIGYGRIIAKDDGAGNLILPGDQKAGRAFIRDQQVIGIVNYATGVATITQPIAAIVQTFQDVYFSSMAAV